MLFPIVYEQCTEPEFAGYYYAHIPSYGLTTHGVGIEGAKVAAIDLLTLWLQEKTSTKASFLKPGESFLSQIELSDALFSP